MWQLGAAESTECVTVCAVAVVNHNRVVDTLLVWFNLEVGELQFYSVPRSG